MIRNEIEKKEELTLSPCACLAINSKGRAREEEADPIRTCFMVDRDRVIHSKSFRRLKHKTQVFIAPRGDHFRTRLTHTLEVNQIAKTIGAGLNINLDLIEAIALAHDVGHTPFAHAGEEILSKLLPGGFHHNINSVRVLTKTEQHRKGNGLNLTAEVLNGVLCHSGYGTLSSDADTLEGQVVKISDKIAYVQHDIDDSIRAGLLDPNELPIDCLEILGRSHSERITTLVADTIVNTRNLIANGTNNKVTPSEIIESALIKLRAFMFEKIYNGEVCQQERKKAMFIIEHLYDYFNKHPEKMTTLYLEIAADEGLQIAVADYISGMSDAYCIQIFESIYIPKTLVDLSIAKDFI